MGPAADPMPGRGIDHLVLCVRDLDAARARYARLGFTLTPRATHPFGTGNSLVQLDGCFLELLTVVEPANIAPPAPGRFSFGAFNRDFLAAREGMSMLALESADARADADEFRRAGLADYAPFDFGRDATLPDGRKVRVAFSLAFVADPRMPAAAFFACQQHAPEHFWKPAYQRHANGARSVAEVIMVAADPPALGGFFARLHGAGNVAAEDGALVVRTPRGMVRVLAPAAFAARFPGAKIDGAPPTPHFAAYRIAVADLAAAARLLGENGVPFNEAAGRLWVNPAETFNAVVEFAA